MRSHHANGAARRPALALDTRKVGDGRVELSVRRGLQRGGDAMLELMGREPALSGSVPQALDDAVSIGV